jgi:hypothetical protein
VLRGRTRRHDALPPAPQTYERCQVRQGRRVLPRIPECVLSVGQFLASRSVRTDSVSFVRGVDELMDTFVLRHGVRRAPPACDQRVDGADPG